MKSKTIYAIDKWPTNGHLIADVARLGYLRKEWRTLDPTYGEGTFWKQWRPGSLVGYDLYTPAPNGAADFTDLPHRANTFDAVVFDPPYKLNGTPSDTDGADSRYGVGGDKYVRWQDRMQLCRDGIVECARVLRPKKGYLLVKCQDQVCSSQVRWQSIDFTNHAVSLGLRLVDRFDFLGGRGQPKDRRQIHARRNSSQLLVFSK